MTYIKHYRQYLNDWRLYAKAVLAALVLFGLIASIALGYVRIDQNHNWDIYNSKHQLNHDYGGYISDWFSYFTHQSNILVFFWLLLAIIFPWKEGKSKLLGTTSQILVATYILITTLIFWLMLVPSSAANGKLHYNALQWVYNIILHAVCGISFIFYTCFWSTKYNYHTAKDWAKALCWTSIIYPIVYCVAILLRGEMRYRSDKPNDTLYPYFFFQIHKNVNGMPGWAWLIIAIIIIGLLCIGISTLIAYAQNQMKEKWWDKTQKNIYQLELGK